MDGYFCILLAEEIVSQFCIFCSAREKHSKNISNYGIWPP